MLAAKLAFPTDTGGAVSAIQQAILRTAVRVR